MNGTQPPAGAVELVTRLGRALHLYGASAHRIEESMARLAAHLGLEAQFFTSPTAIFASFGGAGGERTVLLRIEPGSPDLQKRVETESLLSDLLAGRLEAATAVRRLEEILAAPPRYGAAMTTAAFALTSGSAARFFGGGWREIAAAAAIGLAIGLLALALTGRPTASRLFEPLAAFLATGAAAVLASLAAGTAWAPLAPYVAALAGMIVLVPGLTLTLAMSELGARHLVSGSARLAGALIVFLLIGFGAAAGQRAASVLAGPAPLAEAVPLPAWTELAALAVTAFGLTVLFRARPADYGWVLAGAAVALYGSRAGDRLLGPQFAAFAGAFLLGLAANLLRRLRDRPTALLQVPGLMLLVPGSLGFRSISALLSRDVLSGVEAAFTTILVAVSLVTGLLIANVVAAPRRA